jgi:hypothetical protein
MKMNLLLNHKLIKINMMIINLFYNKQLMIKLLLLQNHYKLKIKIKIKIKL